MELVHLSLRGVRGCCYKSPAPSARVGWLRMKCLISLDISRRAILRIVSIFGVFPNLWFAKPMVWVRVAFHENDGNHENDENNENDEDNSDSYKQGVECWIRGNHGNHENDENHENPGCKPRVPQTTGLEIPEDSLGLKVCVSLTRALENGHSILHTGPGRAPTKRRPINTLSATSKTFSNVLFGSWLLQVRPG